MRYGTGPLHIRCYSKTQDFTLFEQNSLDNLITDLKTVLKDAKTRQEVDVKTTLNLLRLYQSDEAQWGKFALRDQQKEYTRNLVTKVSDIANLLVLVWEPGKSSEIHDHPQSNCFVKVLKGTIHEQLYENTAESTEKRDMSLKRSTEVQPNAVTYITDKIGLHRMSNQGKEIAVSLHLYVPLYEKCTIYEANGKTFTGRDLEFYSVDGEILESDK